MKIYFPQTPKANQAPSDHSYRVIGIDIIFTELEVVYNDRTATLTTIPPKLLHVWGKSV